MWTTSDGEGGSYLHEPDVHKRNKKKRFFDVSVSESDKPSPPVYGRADHNIFCVSDDFTRDKARTSENGGGGRVFQTDDVRQGGGVCPKSQFLLGRLWWITPNRIASSSWAWSLRCWNHKHLTFSYNLKVKCEYIKPLVKNWNAHFSEAEDLRCLHDNWVANSWHKEDITNNYARVPNIYNISISIVCSTSQKTYILTKYRDISFHLLQNLKKTVTQIFILKTGYHLILSNLLKVSSMSLANFEI